MSAEGIPLFSAAEIARRHDAARALMEASDVDALLVFGHSGRRRHNQADVYYLTNCAPQHECYLLMPRSGEATLFVTHHNHLASAIDVSAVADVRRAHKRPAHQIIDEIKKRGYMTVATEDDFRPFEFTLNGKPTGYDQELLELFKKKVGFEVRQDIIPWTGILPGVSTGKYDAAVTAVLVTQ